MISISIINRVSIINQRLRVQRRNERLDWGWVGDVRSEEKLTLYTMLELFLRHYTRMNFTTQKFEGYLIVYAGERSFLIISPFGWDRCVDGDLVVYLEDTIIRRHG